MNPRRTLWRDDAEGRVFLLPDDWKPPAGSLELRAGARRRIRVDPRAVAPYETTPEEARRFLDRRVDAFVAGAVRTIASWPSLPPAPPTEEEKAELTARLDALGEMLRARGIPFPR